MADLQGNPSVSLLKKIQSRIKRNPRFVIAGAALLVLLIILVSVKFAPDKEETTDQNVSVKTVQVQITNVGFLPATLKIEKGTKIVFVNEDSNQHQIQANPHPSGESEPNLRSEILNQGQTYEYVANKSGSIQYHDKLNSATNGTLEIKD